MQKSTPVAFDPLSSRRNLTSHTSNYLFILSDYSRSTPSNFPLIYTTRPKYYLAIYLARLLFTRSNSPHSRPTSKDKISEIKDALAAKFGFYSLSEFLRSNKTVGGPCIATRQRGHSTKRMPSLSIALAAAQFEHCAR